MGRKKGPDVMRESHEIRSDKWRDPVGQDLLSRHFVAVEFRRDQMMRYLVPCLEAAAGAGR